MSAVTLSPWPTSQAALAAAITCLKQVLPDNLTDDQVARLGATAAELVQRYAPLAPQNCRDTAVERCAGWLSDHPSSSVRSEKVGDIETQYNSSNLSALRHSGAMALLTMYKIRRAGVI